MENTVRMPERLLEFMYRGLVVASIFVPHAKDPTFNTLLKEVEEYLPDEVLAEKEKKSWDPSKYEKS